MVGNIYKDFKVSKWALLGMAWLPVFFLGTILYNRDTMEFMEVVMDFSGGLFLLNITMAWSGMLIIGDADEKEKWMVYAIALPGGIKGYVKGKYAFVAVMMVLCALFTLVSSVVFDMIVGENILFFASLMILMISGGISMLFCSLQFPLFFRFGSKKGNAVIGGVFLVVMCAFVIWLMFGDLSILDKLNADFIQQFFLWLQQHKGTVRLAAFLFFMVGIVGMMISYKVSVRAFRKAVEVLE